MDESVLVELARRADVERLYRIQETVRRRVEDVAIHGGDWPCRKGCDDCCRTLAVAPRISRQEWESISEALDGLPAEVAEAARRRIRKSAGAALPMVCPLLDRADGACLVYAARPVACRAYGFYAARDGVFGCFRIEAIAREGVAVVWGNHGALEAELTSLGDAREMPEWLASGGDGGDHRGSRDLDDAREQRRKRKGFGEEGAIRAEVLAHDGVLRAVAARHKDDGRPRAGGVEFAGEVEAGAIRHLDVRDDKVDGDVVAGPHVARLGDVAGLDHAIPGAPQDGRYDG